jgi:ribosomal protein S15P/S13E
MSSNGQADAAVPSELNVMLDLYSDEEDRNAIRKAYYGLAHGDPKTFPVQFSVLLTAHAQALKAYQRPDLDIGKAQVDLSRLTAAVDTLTKRCENVSQIIAIVESLTRARLRWALGIAFGLGVVTIPVLDVFISWLSGLLHC